MRSVDHTRTVGTRKRRMIALGAIVLGALGALTFLEPDGTNTLGERGPLVARVGQQSPDGGVGTSGRQQGDGAGNNSGSPAISPPHAVQDAQAALTGNDEWQERVGQRVAVTVPASRINDGAFWTGDGENRLMVVLARDRRDGAMRQRGDASGFETPLGVGEARVSGHIRRLPHAEAMYSWRLTDHDAAELSRRPVYLHVDTVTPGGPAIPGQRYTQP